MKLATFPLLLLCATTSTSAQSVGIFAAAGLMTMPRFGHTATLLPDGRVLVAGGFTRLPGPPSVSATNTAEVFDPRTSTFSSVGNMTTVRYEHSATLLPDGRVLIAGGADATGHFSLAAELFDPPTGTFSPTGNMSAGHWSATLLGSGKVFMGPLGPGALAEIYDPSTGAFSAAETSADPAISWIGATITSLADGRVLIPADSAPEVFDYASGSFAVTGTMIHPHAGVGRSVTLLPNGTVLFAGGEIDNEYGIGADPAYPGGVYPYGELYDPASGSFALTDNLDEARRAHTATLLPDGSVLITGGDAGQTIQSAELYNASRATFSSAGTMIEARTMHDAALLRDGRVLITGGMRTLGPPPDGQTVLASAEVYTPARPIAAPELFAVSGDAMGQGAIWHSASGAVASASNPAVAGEFLSMYTDNLLDGGVIPPQVAIGGRFAEAVYFGPAPGFPGYFQINFRVPSGVVGETVPVRLAYLGRWSNEVSVSVR